MIKLEWDSKFWEIDIYNLNKDYKFHKPIFNENSQRKWLLQALIPENETNVINKLEDKGFRFIETKVNLVKKVYNKSEIDDNFKKVNEIDIKPYKNDIGDMYRSFSRFSILNEEKISEFYYLWIINSIASKMDDECIGYYINNKLAGFITYRKKDSDISIGLVGVFPEFQNKGIGKKLLDWVNNEAYNKGYEFIKVSTQGKNFKAINTYIKNGYIINNLESWFYLRGRRL